MMNTDTKIAFKKVYARAAQGTLTVNWMAEV
jgi:hypothetical protein